MQGFIIKRGHVVSLLVAYEVVFPVVVMGRFVQIESVTVALIFKTVGQGQVAPCSYVTVTVWDHNGVDPMTFDIVIILFYPADQKQSTRGNVIRAISVLTLP